MNESNVLQSATTKPAPQISSDVVNREHEGSAKDSQNLEIIEIHRLFPMHNQPRKFFDQSTLEELAQSIRTYGVIEPLIVSKDEQNKFFIIAGERRWRASKLAGLKEVPCIIRDLKTHSLLELALIENIQRENLSPLEEANSIQQLLIEHEYTHENLAKRLGKSRASISNAVRILDLPEKIKEDLKYKNITAGHAKALCSLQETKEQLRVHQQIVKKRFSVRQTEEYIQNMKRDKSPTKLMDHISADLRHVCDEFKGHLGTKVKITGDTNRGRIEISYYTLDDLERISELILGNFSLNSKKS